MADHSKNSNTHEPLNRSHSSLRVASLALPRSSNLTNAVDAAAIRSDRRSQSHRLSLSPWRSRPKKQTDEEIDDDPENQHSSALGDSSTGEKKGIWRWKLMRALVRIRMQRLACLFSVEVIAVQGLPASLNGLRLSVTVRKKETKDGAMQTMPTRVLQGSANFEETLFIQCHVYCSGGGGTGNPLKFEPRPFVISVVAIDAPQLDLGKNTVDLSLLVQESMVMENSLDGGHVREWDAVFGLSGKAKGGELVLKLGIQIMEDGGVSIYNQAESFRSTDRGKYPSSPYARKQSKSSFSVTIPRVTRAEPSTIPSKEVLAIESDRIFDFSLNNPEPGLPLVHKSELEPKMEDLDLPEFEVVDKGIEIQGGGEKEEVESKVSADEISVSSEVVKEVVHDRAQQIRLVNLDSIAKQINAFESMMIEDEITSVETAKENKTQVLDAEEERVTREFLQMLDLEEDKEPRYDKPLVIIPATTGAEQDANVETGAFLSDLGQGLGAVVQTGDGGYLASMNPFDVEVARKETPRLAMQISSPFILQDQKHTSVVQLIQRLVATGSEEIGSRLLALAAIDELAGKTAEQIAFEGIASTIINWRNKEGASSSAARSIAVVKKMATAIAEGRRERILTGIWNVKENPVLMEEILTISLQKMEAIAVEALKIQAEMTDEEAPFDVSPLIGIEDSDCPLASAISPEDWAKNKGTDGTVTLLMIIQLRDPIRSYEAVGGPMIAVVQAERVDDTGEHVEGRLKVTSLHIGGLKLRSAMKRSAWDGEKQRLTAMQWLVAYGMGKARKKKKPPQVKVGQDSLWSISSRVMAGMWLSPTRNPDLKVP